MDFHKFNISKKMREIICVGGSNTSYRRPDKLRFYDGYCPDINDKNAGTGSYPEAIHRNFGNKVYNLGVASNTIQCSVLSVISFSQKLLNNGNTNFSIIFNATDLQRKSIYFSNNTRIIKNIPDDISYPILNNYLFDNTKSGFLLFGGMQNISNNAFENKELIKISKAYSENIFSIESEDINSITHLLLLQNFCKSNNIPYKIFFDMDFFSSPLMPIFDINTHNTSTFFNSFFIDKKLVKKEQFGSIKLDNYTYDLFTMLDLNDCWFYTDENVKNGGIQEWIFKNNEYKEGDTHYIPLYIEDISHLTHELTDNKYILSIDSVLDKIKNNTFIQLSHPTYYYWEKFTKEVIASWGLL